MVRENKSTATSVAATAGMQYSKSSGSTLPPSKRRIVMYPANRVHNGSSSANNSNVTGLLPAWSASHVRK